MIRAISLAACVACVVAAPAFAKGDEHPTGKAFVSAMIQGDNSEVLLGKIAAERGNARTKAFGVMLVRDHAKARVAAVKLAKQIGADVPTDIAPEAQTELTRLGGLQKAAFDREFARYMVEDHEHDIAKANAELATRDDARIKAMARTVLPTLRHHLMVARKLQKA